MPGTIVIADDVTGANDIGVMYAKAGLDTYVYSYKEGENTVYPPCDVLVIDTDSRFDSHEDAYRKVFHALKGLPGESVKQFISKQCSVFRGNIGAEFDAMLDALGEKFAVVVLGFPNNGRTTLHSRHYVYGTLLENSQFRHDPVHPMTRSNLVEILQEQTKRKVGAIYYEVYDQGEAAVAEALQEARGRYDYVIMDVRDNRDLEMLARILRKEKVLCGSSALSEYLARQETAGNPGEKPCRSCGVQGRVFCMVGSLTPQSFGQADYMKEKGYPVIEADTEKVLDRQARAEEECRVLAEIMNAYRNSDFVLLRSAGSREAVERTKKLALEKGVDNTEISTMVSDLLSDIAQKVIRQLEIRRLIICGGDTSASLCSHLKVKGMKILEEIEAGLPVCESVEEPYYRMVLKSGSFGSREFIGKAMEKLSME